MKLDFIEPVYLVGGSVRDVLMGKEPKDYDFTTPLLPNDIEAKIRLAGKKPYNIGKKFGTVGVKIDGQMVEITTFRKENYLPKSRKPNVEYVNDLQEDLARRDFTINAIAQDSRGKLVDPFEGIKDLTHKTIRAVGKPKDRFRDDPLRLLRAIRFAAQFDFIIEEKTLEAIKKMASSILDVSKERWIQEMDKILLADRVDIGLSYLWSTRLMNFMFPELALQHLYDQKSPYHQHTLDIHTIGVVQGTPRDVEMRWAALFHDSGKPFVQTVKPSGQCNYIEHEKVSAAIVKRYSRYLAWSNDRADRVVDLVANHMNEDSPLREADKGAH